MYASASKIPPIVAALIAIDIASLTNFTMIIIEINTAKIPNIVSSPIIQGICVSHINVLVELRIFGTL